MFCPHEPQTIQTQTLNPVRGGDPLAAEASRGRGPLAPQRMAAVHAPDHLEQISCVPHRLKRCTRSTESSDDTSRMRLPTGANYSGSTHLLKQGGRCYLCRRLHQNSQCCKLSDPSGGHSPNRLVSRAHWKAPPGTCTGPPGSKMLAQWMGTRLQHLSPTLRTASRPRT